MKAGKAIVASGVLALLFSACAAPRLGGLDALPALDFRIRGKIAVRGAGDAFSASFDWRQAGERFEIELWGPFGQGRAQVRGRGGAASITDDRGVTRQGADAAALMRDVLGWSAPTAALRHWVRGRYDPAMPTTEEKRAEDGRLAAFEQLGWAVRLSRWRDTAIGPAPARIVLARDGRRIVVACKEWATR